MGFCDARPPPPPGGLKTAKSFQCARPLERAPRAENEKTKHSVFTWSTFFLNPQRKKKSTFVSGPNLFCRLGSGISPGAQIPPKTRRWRISRKPRVKPPNVVIARKLRNTNAVPMSQKTLIARTPTGHTAPAFSMGSNFGWRAFHPEWPPRSAKSDFPALLARLGPRRPRHFSEPP